MRYQTLAGQAALIRRLGLVMDPQRFPPEFFQREDDTNDAEFYTMPRLVVHIDDGATTAVGRLFQQLIPENAEVLDLMSSWRTHWPEEHPRCPASTILVFSEWERIFANPMATAAAIDRVVHHSVILEFDVPSYRTNAAQQRVQAKEVNRQN